MNIVEDITVETRSGKISFSQKTLRMHLLEIPGPGTQFPGIPVLTESGQEFFAAMVNSIEGGMNVDKNHLTVFVPKDLSRQPAKWLYDWRGFPVAITSYNLNGNGQRLFGFEFDSQGRLIEESWSDCYPPNPVESAVRGGLKIALALAPELRKVGVDHFLSVEDRVTKCYDYPYRDDPLKSREIACESRVPSKDHVRVLPPWPKS